MKYLKKFESNENNMIKKYREVHIHVSKITNMIKDEIEKVFKELDIKFKFQYVGYYTPGLLNDDEEEVFFSAVIDISDDKLMEMSLINNLEYRMFTSTITLDFYQESSNSIYYDNDNDDDFDKWYSNQILDYNRIKTVKEKLEKKKIKLKFVTLHNNSKFEVNFDYDISNLGNTMDSLFKSTNK